MKFEIVSFPKTMSFKSALVGNKLVQVDFPLMNPHICSLQNMANMKTEDMNMGIVRYAPNGDIAFINIDTIMKTSHKLNHMIEEIFENTLIAAKQRKQEAIQKAIDESNKKSMIQNEKKESGKMSVQSEKEFIAKLKSTDNPILHLLAALGEASLQDNQVQTEGEIDEEGNVSVDKKEADECQCETCKLMRQARNGELTLEELTEIHGQYSIALHEGTEVHKMISEQNEFYAMYKVTKRNDVLSEASSEEEKFGTFAMKQAVDLFVEATNQHDEEGENSEGLRILKNSLDKLERNIAELANIIELQKASNDIEAQSRETMTLMSQSLELQGAHAAFDLIKAKGMNVAASKVAYWHKNPMAAKQYASEYRYGYEQVSKLTFEQGIKAAKEYLSGLNKAVKKNSKTKEDIIHSNANRHAEKVAQTVDTNPLANLEAEVENAQKQKVISDMPEEIKEMLKSIPGSKVIAIGNLGEMQLLSSDDLINA